MRVTLLPVDALGNTQPFPYNSGEGAGIASGFEFEVVYVPTERLTLNFGLGLIDTEYIQAGVFDGVTGNYPGAPFAYAAEESGTVGAQYDIPMRNGGRFLLVGNVGYIGRLRARRRVSTHADRSGHAAADPRAGLHDRQYAVRLRAAGAATTASRSGARTCSTSCTSTAGSILATRGATTSRSSAARARSASA